MGVDQARVADELLELENTYRTNGKLTEQETRRWEECAQQLFSEQTETWKRRSSRLPVAANCQLKVGQGTFPAVMTEVSRIGFTVASLVFKYASPESVEILRIDLPEHSKQLRLACTLDRVDYSKDPPSAGLTIKTAEIGHKEWQEFFDAVYYPTYVSFLEARAGRPSTIPPPPAGKSR